MALKDLVSILALPKSSAHALLRTLQSRGYVERDAADRYVLNESLRQSSGWIGGPEAHLAAVARPVMDQLRDDLDETVFGTTTEIAGNRGSARCTIGIEPEHFSPAAIRTGFRSPRATLFRIAGIEQPKNSAAPRTSTRRFMVIAAVCHPLAARPLKKVCAAVASSR